MKSYLYTFLSLLIPVIVLAQYSNEKTIYLDSLFIETKQQDYKYYMIVKDYDNRKSDYFITRYYTSGKIESQGISESRDYFLKKGEITSYYENENMKSIKFFRDKCPVGKCEFWYKNGIKKLEGEYILSIEDDKTKKSNLIVTNSWDKNNIQIVINGDGDYEDDEGFEDINSYLMSISSGKVKDGLKDGIWIGSNSKRNFTFSEEYENGKLISGESNDSNNEKHLYTTIEKMPDYKYGINKFRGYVGKNYRVPDEGLSGKIFATFIIDKNGKLINPTIIRGLGFKADNELIRVLSESTDWIPGENRGIKTSFKFSFPITIQSPR